MNDSERAWRRIVHMVWTLVLVGCGVACAHEQPPLNPS